MPNVMVGSVTAELLLNTEKFNSSIKQVQAQVKDLNTSFRGTNAKEMAEQISRLEQQLEKNTKVIKQQEEVIKQLKAGYDGIDKELLKVAENSAKASAENEKLIKSEEKVASVSEKTASSLRKVNLEYANLGKTKGSNFGTQLTGYMNKLLNFMNKDFRADSAKVIKDWGIGTVAKQIQTLSDKFKTLRYTLGGQSQYWSKDIEAMAKWEAEVRKVIATAEKGVNAVKLFHMGVKSNTTSPFAQPSVNTLNTLKSQIGSLGNFGANIDVVGDKVLQVRNKIQKTAQDMTQSFESLAFLLGEKYVASVNKWSESSGKVTSGMSAFAQSNERVRASLQQSYDALNNAGNSFKRFDEIVKVSQESLKRFGTTAPNLESFKSNMTSIYELMARFGTVYETGISESNRWNEAVRQSAVTLQDYYKNIEQASMASSQYAQRQQQLVASQQEYTSVINNASGQMARQREIMAQFNATYPSANAELTKFAEAQARLGNSLTSTNPKFSERIGYLQRLKAEENQTSASTNKLGNSITQASAKMGTMTGATSKLQGALSSTKMILSTLSSMFIWTFGMSLWEATKQTVSSKNEMESYLHQMGLGRGSIDLFNRGLDETAERFKKLNKYMIGETIAGIGMEFDLTANQMKKSMDVVAMIQNEYVRAGRKEEEATLAVKDILQGEFLRLSRETGVGKADLEATGLWSGDLKDIEGLMEALRKVGTDRHWELFASKCNSLNDVVSETKNRISEFGASLVDQLSPAIINGFNMIIETIDKVTSSWNNFDPMQKMAVGLPIAFAFGTALMMVAGKMSLLDIAQMGYTKGLITTVFQLDVATVKEYGLATAITSKITAIEGSTVAEMGNATAIASRLLGLNAELVAEYGLQGALLISSQSKDLDTVATEVNTLAKEGNVIATSTGTTVTTEFTIVEELATALQEENTVMTEANTIAQEYNNVSKTQGAMANMNFVKTLYALVSGLEAEEVATMSTTEATWGLITSLTVLEAIAVIAVIAGIAVTLGSLAMEAQRAKEAIDGFYDIVDNGDAYIEDSKRNIESLGKQYDNLGEKIAEAQAKGEDPWKMEQTREQVKSNKEFAEAQLKDLEEVNQKAKDASKNYQDTITNANTDFERRNAEIFKKLGHDTNKAGEYANQYTQQYLNGMAQMEKATNAYTSTLDTGVTHMEGQIDVLKEAGANQETLTQYAKDYGEEVLKNAQYQKEWAEGDFWAIFKIGLSDLKLAWIDFTYWVGQQDWWKDLCNALGDAKNAMVEFYNAIKPAIPIITQIIGLILQGVWIHIVNVAHALYMIAKALYPVLRDLGENLYGMGVDIYNTFKWAYDSLVPVYDKLKEIKDLLDNWNEKPDEEKGADIVKGILSVTSPLGLISELGKMDWTQIGNDVINGLYNGLVQALDNQFHFEKVGQSFTEVITNGIKSIQLDTISQSFQEVFGGINIIQMITDAIFNSGDSENGGAGVAKDIPDNNLITQIIRSGLGDDPWGAVQSAVDMYLVQPFSQAIQTGLANIPIIGSILSFLGLIDGASPTASEKGNNLAQSFGWAVENKIRNIPILGDILAFLGVIDSSYPTANSKGHGVGQNVHDGVNAGKQGTADLIRNEMWELIGAVAGAVADAYNYACQVGQAILGGINSVIQHHSPGIPALLIADEMVEIQNSMANAEAGIYAQAQNIGYAITSGIQPNTDVSFDAEAMAQYQADMVVAMGMAGETVDTSESAFSQLDYSTSLTFANIGTTIGTTMTNIANTTKLNYNNIALTTKTQLANMQSQTTKNIGAIRQSWTGMQIALINSAEHIRSETGAKIQSLQNNMASFWRKVQNPALLLGAGDPSEQKRVSKPQRFSSTGGGVRKILRPSGYAGAKSNTSTKSSSAGFSRDKSILEKLPKHLLGVSLLDKYEEQIMAYFSDANHKKIENIDIAMEYLKCLFSGGNCVAGGWDFNWSDDIKQALLTWHTHFGDIYDPYLYVGKFENDDFPIRGIAPIALNYIQDAIGRTQYEFYYDQKYGSPLEAWNAGHFNCYDGALLVMALASALGFPNSHMVHGSWGGIGHVWAYVEGLGNIDATAIQGGYGLTAPSRTGVAGTPTLQKRFKHNKNQSSSDENNGNVFHGDINIHIDGAGKNTEEIGREVRNVMVDLMSPNPATGI